MCVLCMLCMLCVCVRAWEVKHNVCPLCAPHRVNDVAGPTEVCGAEAVVCCHVAAKAALELQILWRGRVREGMGTQNSVTSPFHTRSVFRTRSFFAHGRAAAAH